MLPKRLLVTCFMLFGALLSSVAFGVPYELYYSGRLTTVAGTPLEGPINIEIKFFRSESGSDEVAVTVPAFTDVSLDEGTFALSIQLTPAQFHTVFPDSSSSPTYIQLKDTTHDQVYPRLVYSVVPFALKVPVDNSTVGYNSDGKLTVLNLGGDVTGAGGSTLVTKIQGNSVSNASPASGEVLKWNGSSWVPSSAGGVGTVTSVASGTGLTGGPITGTGTLSLATSGVTAGTYSKVTVDTYGRATSGTSLAASDLPSSVDAVKIGSGTIDNTEFGYLNGVTSAIQTQIDGKASSSHTQAATTIGSGLVSDTEFSYLDGVTSAIQTQLNGKVAGPASASDNAIARFDGTTGKLMQNSGVVIDDSGNLGIGTTAPSGKIEGIIGYTPAATGITRISNYSDAFYLTRSSNIGKQALVFRGSDAIGSVIETGRENELSNWNTYFAFYTQGGANTDSIQERVRINGSGNVGIGTTSPNKALEISGTGHTGERITAGATYNPHIQLFNTSTGRAEIGYNQANNFIYIDKITENGGLTAPIAINGTNGNVGIGTANPSTTLDVNGAIKVGTLAVACDGSQEGKLRYNSTYHNMEFCNGTSWISMNASAAMRAQSCSQLLQAGFSIGDGVYWIYPLQGNPVQVYCDMTTDGGGWTICARQTFSGTNNFLGLEQLTTVWGNVSTPGSPFGAGCIQLMKSIRNGGSVDLFLKGSYGEWQWVGPINVDNVYNGFLGSDNANCGDGAVTQCKGSTSGGLVAVSKLSGCHHYDTYRTTSSYTIWQVADGVNSNILMELGQGDLNHPIFIRPDCSSSGSAFNCARPSGSYPYQSANVCASGREYGVVMLGFRER